MGTIEDTGQGQLMAAGKFGHSNRPLGHGPPTDLIENLRFRDMLGAADSARKVDS